LYFPEENSKQLDQDEIIEILDQEKMRRNIRDLTSRIRSVAFVDATNSESNLMFILSSDAWIYI
jgi:hypothetical protein